MNADEIFTVLDTLPLTTPNTGVQIDRYMVVRTSIDGSMVSSTTRRITLGKLPMSKALAKRLAARPTVVTVGSTMKTETLRDVVTKAIAPLHATVKLTVKSDPMATALATQQTVERLAVSVAPRDGVSWAEMLSKTASALRAAGLIAVAERGACRVMVMPDLAA